MALTAGTKLGPYEIVGAAGAGGMGEVYRAKDTRLERTVAIKVLPSHLSANPDLKQRFEREAKAISSLQHPHICTLFDVGSQDGVDFLVMEYLEGETLAEPLVKGPLKVDEGLKIGIAMADALDKAHRQGIVHRDLKPGNVMLTKSGAKLMDFGLAKPALAIGAAASHVTPNTPTMSVAALTSPASPLTQKGTIVGTFQYMAPEVLQGADADARSDIFSFGCVLYEMITRRRAFEGKSQVSVLAAILDKEPESVLAVQPTTPAAVQFCVQTCLAKDPELRFQTARDVSLQLRWASTTSLAAAKQAAPTTASSRLPRIAAVLFLLFAVSAIAFLLGRKPENTEVITAEIPAPEKLSFNTTGDNGGVPVISPAGDQIAFTTFEEGNKSVLWVRPLNSPVAHRLDGTYGAYHPFWSADGRYIGFYANEKLNKIPSAGGPVTVLADASTGRGGTWSKDNIIVFTPTFNSALMQVNAGGGPATPVTTLDKVKHSTHRWPWMLPDGKHFLYLATNHQGGSRDQNGIYFASLEGKENHLVIATDAAAEYGNGYLLYRAQNALVAQPFDASTGKLSGEPVTLVANIRYDGGIWRAIFSISQDGKVIYQSAANEQAGTKIGWFERSGKLLQEAGPRGMYEDLRLSHDGRRVAFAAGEATTDIWVLDLDRGVKTRITFAVTGGPMQRMPSWSPDDRDLIFVAGTGTSSSIHRIASNGSGKEENLTATPHLYEYPSISPDGKYLVYLLSSGQRTRALWARPLAGGSEFPIVELPMESSRVYSYRVSPNSRWVAYQSDETGRPEIYVTSFPKGDGKWQISSNGGAYPAWRADGKELYYKELDETTFAIPVTEKADAIDFGARKQLFKISQPGAGIGYDVAPNGERFLVTEASDQSTSPLTLVVNWPSEVKKK